MYQLSTHGSLNMYQYLDKYMYISLFTYGSLDNGHGSILGQIYLILDMHKYLDKYLSLSLDLWTCIKTPIYLSGRVSKPGQLYLTL